MNRSLVLGRVETLGRLDRRSRYIVECRRAGHSLEQIAAALGVSKQRVHRLEWVALKRMNRRWS